MKERVLKIAKEMDYVLQRQIRLRGKEQQNKPLLVGVLLPGFGHGPKGEGLLPPGK